MRICGGALKLMESNSWDHVRCLIVCSSWPGVQSSVRPGVAWRSGMSASGGTIQRRVFLDTTLERTDRHVVCTFFIRTSPTDKEILYLPSSFTKITCNINVTVNTVSES